MDRVLPVVTEVPAPNGASDALAAPVVE